MNWFRLRQQLKHDRYPHDCDPVKTCPSDDLRPRLKHFLVLKSRRSVIRPQPASQTFTWESACYHTYYIIYIIILQTFWRNKHPVTSDSALIWSLLLTGDSSRFRWTAVVFSRMHWQQTVYRSVLVCRNLHDRLVYRRLWYIIFSALGLCG